MLTGKISLVIFFEKNNLEKIEDENQTKKSAGLTWFRIIFGRFRPIINEIILFCRQITEKKTKKYLHCIQQLPYICNRITDE